MAGFLLAIVAASFATPAPSSAHDETPQVVCPSCGGGGGASPTPTPHPTATPQPTPTPTYVAPGTPISQYYYVTTPLYNTWMYQQVDQFQPTGTNGFEAFDNLREDSGDSSGRIQEEILYCKGSCYGSDTNVFFGEYYNAVGSTPIVDSVLLLNNPPSGNNTSSVAQIGGNPNAVNLYVNNVAITTVPANSLTGSAMFVFYFSYDAQKSEIVQPFTSGVNLTGIQYYPGGPTWYNWPSSVSPSDSWSAAYANVYLNSSYYVTNQGVPTAVWSTSAL